jgi:hypothetical protein
MKRSILFLLAICLFFGTPVSAQVGRFVNKVKSSVANDVIGKSETNSGTAKQEPEPKCACDQPEKILDLGGTLKLMYSELSIDVLDDGSILVKDRVSGKYYIAKSGTPKGPYEENDPQVAPFIKNQSSDSNDDSQATLNKEYITKSGDKFLITFKGKTYGPYGQITSFAVTRSKDKFAAIVVENIISNESDSKKMEAAMKNAKTDQERMDLAMKYSQQMQQQMMAGGGPKSIMPKFITNIPGTTFDPSQGGMLNAEMKYDDILVSGYDGIKDLKGNKVIAIKPEHAGSGQIFVNTDNTKYAAYNYGTLNFSDGTTMSDMFNLHLMKSDGKVYIAYMYYSPKSNAVMQCKIPF